MLAAAATPPPGVPAERALALRRAFDATMRDADFLEDARRLSLDVAPVDGAEIEALLKESYAAPRAVVKLATKLLRDVP